MKYLSCALLCLSLVLKAEAKSFKVLFIGNSYTDVNNLPEVVKQIAASLNDTLVYQKSTPGSYTFQDHSTDATTLGLIAQGGWDYVVLQEQSQYPSFPMSQVQDEVFPYAKKLDSLVHLASPCAKTVFYMTWGRENGDPDNCPGWPPVCTYQGMDSLLQQRYGMMAQDNHAWVSPVAKVWHAIRTNNPAIELYQADGSHPSIAGTYLAALSFYAVLYGKNPALTTYTFGVNATDANTIRLAAKSIAYDSLTTWRQYGSGLTASYTYTSTNHVFNFVSTVTGNAISSYNWNFGDGSPEVNTQNATHTFTNAGSFQVCLTVKDTCGTDSYCASVNSGAVGIEPVVAEKAIAIYPNPGKDFIQINNLAATSEYAIYNTLGVKLKSGKIDVQQHSIDVKALSAGIYYLEIKNEKTGQLILKWAKQ
jgi:hypothetical protein